MKANGILCGVGAFLAAAMLSACGSIGDVFGSGDEPKQGGSQVQGEILAVDSAARRITLETNTYESRESLRPQRGERTLYYDERTLVEFEGDSYRPEDLERGDEVSIRYERQSGRDVAERITVLEDARAGSAGDADATVLRGVIGDFNSGERRIELERAYGDGRDEDVYYDDRTVVEFEGKQYRPENLERGDEVRVIGERRSGRFLAERIVVERDATVADSGDDAALDDVRGTVRAVDSRNRRIDVDLEYGERGDERIYYDERTAVSLAGRELRPDSLRSGDEISASGSRREGRFLADSIRVLREYRSSE